MLLLTLPTLNEPSISLSREATPFSVNKLTSLLALFNYKNQDWDVQRHQLHKIARLMCAFYNAVQFDNITSIHLQNASLHKTDKVVCL